MSPPLYLVPPPVRQHPASESLLASVRARLARAHELEVDGQHERAKAFSAMAANRLAAAIRIRDRLPGAA